MKLVSKIRNFFNQKSSQVIEGESQVIEREIDPAEIIPRESFFGKNITRTELLRRVFDANVQVRAPVPVYPNGQVMDSSLLTPPSIAPFSTGVPESLLSWYGSQGFIGYQMCVFIAQHWLVDKACTMPAFDAVRKGYQVTVNDGTPISADIQSEIENVYDTQYRLTKNLVEFVKMGRIFGIRIALFEVRSSDPEYYEKPFNIDGVTPGSYQGISQIDPYWITPELDADATSDPASMNFYEPTWWRISTKRVHRSHLIIMRNSEVPDLLKPTYIYGGISVPQKIYERVYAAERIANEAPMLALTKRTMVIKVDTAKALANQQLFEQNLQRVATLKNNYGQQVIDLTDEVQHFDVALADLDQVMMTEYQIVAAIAEVPAVKLMGTSPKGFNSTGEFEEANYHETLESIQTTFLTPLLDRHYAILIRSEIAPKFGITPFEVSIKWNPLDAMTAKEEAELNKLKAETDSLLANTGAIDAYDIRDRNIKDPTSGYSGIDEEVPEPLQEEFQEEEEKEQRLENKREDGEDFPNPYTG